MSKVDKASRAAGILRGIKKHFGQRNAILLGGAKYTPSQLAAEFEEHIKAIRRVDLARATLTSEVAQERALARKVGDLARWLKSLISAEFGLGAQLWADFGLTPPKKPGPKTLQAKLVGAERARATRKRRGTMGKRQRKKSERAQG